MSRRHIAWGALLTAWLTGAAFGQEADDPRRAALEQWIEARRTASREAEAWRSGRQLFEERIRLVRRETESLREKTAQARKDITEADGKLADLKAQNDELKTATAGLGDVATRLERRMLELLAQSPSPIRERVKPLSQRIPTDPEATKMGISERFQNVVGILNELNKFSREITVASEVRSLPGGTNAEVMVLYAGMGAAFYCSANGTLAGAGTPGTNGWTWTPSNELAEAVSAAIAVYRNERPAGYIPLPVDVRPRGSRGGEGTAP